MSSKTVCPNGFGQNTQKRRVAELLSASFHIHAESVSVVLIAHTQASRSTLINEEIIKSIMLNSTGPFTAQEKKRKRVDF